MTRQEANAIIEEINRRDISPIELFTSDGLVLFAFSNINNTFAYYLKYGFQSYSVVQRIDEVTSYSELQARYNAAVNIAAKEWNIPLDATKHNKS